RQWGNLLQIVDDGEVVAEVCEYQDREREAGFGQRQVRVLRVTFALRHLNLRLDDVGTGDFAAALLLLRDLKELLRLGEALLGACRFSRGCDDAVIVLHDGDDEASGRDVGARTRNGFGRGGAPILGPAR